MNVVRVNVLGSTHQFKGSVSRAGVVVVFGEKRRDAVGRGSSEACDAWNRVGGHQMLFAITRLNHGSDFLQPLFRMHAW